jgi:hypothetical protein
MRSVLRRAIAETTRGGRSPFADLIGVHRDDQPRVSAVRDDCVMLDLPMPELSEATLLADQIAAFSTPGADARDGSDRMQRLQATDRAVRDVSRRKSGRRAGWESHPSRHSRTAASNTQARLT